MKKLLYALLVGCLVAFPSAEAEEIDSKTDELNIAELENYYKEFKAEEIGVCSNSSTKTYEDYRAITSRTSTQYKFIHEHMTVDEDTGFLYDEDGFIGVALGSYYGVIGDRFYFTLDSGVVLPVVKIDEKSDKHTVNGCAHAKDGSVIEFVINKDYAAEGFGTSTNSYVSSGNYNNIPLFKGHIEKVELVSEEKASDLEFNFETIQIRDLK